MTVQGFPPWAVFSLFYTFVGYHGVESPSETRNLPHCLFLRSGRPPYTIRMSQTERIFKIDEIIRTKGSVTCATIAELFEVSERQIKRDIEYMRDRIDAPIVWDWRQRAYRYDREYPRLKFSDEKTLVFSALLHSIVKSTDMVPLVSEQALELVDQALSEGYRQLSDKIVYTFPVTDSPDYGIFSTICTAIGKGLCISLDYSNAKGERSNRTVEPLRLINYSGRWYVVAFDLSKDDLRSFHLGRMEAVHIQDRLVVERHLEERLERHMSAGFGMFMGSTVQEAVIRFNGDAVYTVEHQCWHKDQKLERSIDEHGNTVLVLHVPIANDAELLGRILSFGPLAVPLAPDRLCARWSEAVAALAALADDMEKH